MEVKKADQRDLSKGLAKKSPSRIAAVAEFIGEVKEEFKRITWTSRDEIRSYAKIVVGMTFCCGLAIYLVDLVIRAALGTISSLFHLIVG
jgi:preprotein translocase subunit SecE